LVSDSSRERDRRQEEMAKKREEEVKMGVMM